MSSTTSLAKSVCAIALVCGLTAFAEAWDVVVVGGTTRAVEAAVAAKKAGAKTLLVAPHPLLSDDVAGQLRLDAYENPEAAALPERFRLKREDVTNYPFATLTPNAAKYAAMLALQSNAVPFRLATAVADIARDASGANVLQTFDRGGEGSLVAKAVIDATGFTALGEKAGVEFAPFKPGRRRFVRYVMNGSNTAFAPDVEVREFQNYWNAAIPGWDVKAPANFPGSFKVRLFRCTWETDMEDDSPLTLAKIDSAFRDRTFGPLQADAGDQFFAEKPLRPLVRGVKVVTADGRKGAIRAAVTIDATGNADVAAAAGAPTVFGARREEAPVLQGASISWRDIACSVMNCEVTYVDAHRLSTIRDAAVILYMENGDIKEVGNHDTLMKRGGKYAELYNSQFG